MQLVIGRIAKAHGITGEVSVDVRTDDPDHRYSHGAVLATDPVEKGPLTIAATRWHSGRLLIRFEGIVDRNGAEALQGTLLVADSGTSRDGNEDEFWDHDLVGLDVSTVDGTAVGTVSDVLHPPGPSLLVIKRGGGGEVLVPFVSELVPTIDVAAGRIVIDPPEGLLELGDA